MTKKKNAPLPASSAGLLRFFEDETKGFKVRPEIVLGLTGALIGVSFIIRIIFPVWVRGKTSTPQLVFRPTIRFRPKRCPKCSSVRWNQRYLDEEIALIDRLQDELYETGLIRESGEKIEYEGNEILGTKPRVIYPYDYDFISYDFLKQTLPQPELFIISFIYVVTITWYSI